MVPCESDNMVYLRHPDSRNSTILMVKQTLLAYEESVRMTPHTRRRLQLSAVEWLASQTVGETYETSLLLCRMRLKYIPHCVGMRVINVQTGYLRCELIYHIR